MKSCRYEKDLERWFDGELVDAGEMDSHVEQCTVCTDALEGLRKTREAVRAVAAREEISDAQFPAFMDGLRRQLEEPRHRPGRLWAFVSIAAAACIVAVSTLFMFSQGPTPVAAQSVIEDASTEIDGATTSAYYSDDGTATVWVNVPEGDMW